ncbi:Peptidyl-prolyl cis-trans isomerase, EpsD family [Methylocaldum szegediense]|uniref:Peptidyl-prolyl cis-trans isomerase, EpsD family n=2 Tax=Methylocaldum szegediense TaxID=73780 RepID=A0ABM9HW42_9GAMM|nr:EpsD family peptidyl-prolyl cis-trans isomerase [Methylocaldum szegediense]CAI8725239.1 Peptidyl-prolyl cis-trans isomerase, EpsD family [Methylocaldum szegediense]
MERKLWLKSLPLSAYAMLATLMGCEGQTASDGAARIVARVNGDPISAAQLDVFVAHSDTSADSQTRSLEKSLDDLVTQELLSQQAIEKQLDRDPQVTLTAAMAQRQVLAQAYLDHIGQKVSKPDINEISAFYKSHPLLFEKRKIYEFREIAIPFTPESQDVIETRLKHPIEFDALSRWLQDQAIPHTSQTVVRAAEELPLGRLDEFDRLKKGDIAWFKSGKDFLVLQLLNTKEAPLDPDEAAPRIEAFLINQRRIALINSELRRLRNAATIEYFDDIESTVNTSLKTRPPAELVSNDVPGSNTH